MSKRQPSTAPFARSAKPMLECLETRTLMSVGPANIANGGANDAVYDADAGTLHVVFYDKATKDLKYQSFDDDGSTSGVTTIDAPGDVGQYISLAEDANGVLHAAYYDTTNADLKYARRDTAGVWSVTTIDAKNSVGMYPSLAIAANGQPAVSYYNKSGGNLKLALFNGTAWSISTIASTNDVGRYSSLAVNPTTNKLNVAFGDSTAGAARFAEQDKNWAIKTIDDTTGQAEFISLNYVGGRPAISYYDEFNGNLKYAERSAKSQWSSVTAVSHLTVGLYSDLAFTFNTGQPAIIYYNKTSDTAVFAFRSPGKVWTLQTQVTGGGQNVTAVDGAEDLNGVPALYLVYSDTATGGLKVGTF